METDKWKDIKTQYRGLSHGNPVYECMIDNSTTMGLLHCTHEMDITVVIDVDNNNEIHLLSVWEIGVDGDWEYNKDEEDLFKADHPGVLDELRLICIDKYKL